MNETNEGPEFLEAYREPDQRIKNVIEYLQKNPSCKILLKDLSGIALLSPCHLQRIFKKAVGLTPKEYLLRLRVKMTMQLLKQGLTLSEIVSLTGFTDKSHLTRTFKQITGLTPKSYAEQMNDQ
jgi:transcriptional regulator GlxA family with amidase domain